MFVLSGSEHENSNRHLDARPAAFLSKSVLFAKNPSLGLEDLLQAVQLGAVINRLHCERLAESLFLCLFLEIVSMLRAKDYIAKMCDLETVS